jgi:hypothetical protein
LYEYWHEQVKIRKKRWNNKEIKKFYWKYICRQKVKKGDATSACAYIVHNNGNTSPHISSSRQVAHQALIHWIHLSLSLATVVAFPQLFIPSLSLPSFVMLIFFVQLYCSLQVASSKLFYKSCCCPYVRHGLSISICLVL